MSFDPESQTDLALNDEDAESVVGGKRKTAKKVTKAAKPHVAAVPMIKVEIPASQLTNDGTMVENNTADDEDCGF